MQNFINFSVSEITSSKSNSNGKSYIIPGFGEILVDVQSISNEALEKIFTQNYLTNPHIPSKKDIITLDVQTEYFKDVKGQVIQRLQENKFAIISGPTGTGKTTLARTIAYEGGLSFYEVVGDQDKSIKTFFEEIKTLIKGSTPQIKSFPGKLLKAITNGGIFCINEANLLPQDVIIGLANLVENGFVIFNGKKYKVHPNFSLLFTSNEGYLHAKDYNSAVLRKASGKVLLDYEQDENQEVKIVKSIYEKTKLSLNTSHTISPEDLEKIAKAIFQTRSSLNYETLNDQKKFYSEDISDYSHFFYIRLYEKIIGLMLEKGGSLSLKELVLGVLPKLNPFVGGGLIGSDYVERYENDVELFNSILDTNLNLVISISNQVVESGLDTIDTTGLDRQFLQLLQQQVPGLFLDSLDKGGNTKTVARKPTGLNHGFFRQTLVSQVKSTGEQLKRTENIEEIALAFYGAIVESKKIKDIKIIGFSQNSLEINILGQTYFLSSENKETITILKSLGESKSIYDFRQNVFGNPEIFINFLDKDGFLETIPNILSNPKSFEIRRRNKLIQFEKDGKKYVSFLGFSGNIKDIRYVGEDSGNYYIPQSQASDVIFSLYEVSEEIPEKGHFFIIADSGELEVKTKVNYTSGVILKRINSESSEFLELEANFREKFFNLDNLNLQNGGKELAQTGTPAVIIGTRHDIQSQILDSIGRSLDIITPSTSKILERITQSYLIGTDVMLTGESGTGKTSIAKYFAKQMNLPYLSLQISEDFSERELVGGYVWNEGVIEEVLGSFLNYYIYGGVVELKELNMAFLSVFLNQYMDKNGTIVFAGKTYQRNPNFIIIATRNPFDQIVYPGTKPINLALEARFTHITVEELSKDESTQVIKSSVFQKNPNFIEVIGGEESLNEIIEVVLDIAFHIRTKISELRITQESSTSEILISYLKVKLTIDKMIGLFNNSKDIVEFKHNLISMFNLEEKEKNMLFSFDKELASMIQRLVDNYKICQ